MDGPSKNILLIETNADLREATRDLLEALGHRVLTAATGRRALSTQADSLQSIDLLVCNAYDADLPGLEIVRRFRQSSPGLPALLLSGFGDDPDLRRGAAAGEIELLQVPFSAERMAKAADSALARAPRGESTVLRAPDRRPRPPIALRRFAAAAILVLGLGVAFWANRDAAPALPAYEAEVARRGAHLEALSPTGEIESRPRRLVWRGVAEAQRYRVTLRQVDDTPLWQADTAALSIDLPDDLRQALEPAVAYLWSVEAVDSDEVVLAWSETVRFLVTPEPGDADK